MLLVVWYSKRMSERGNDVFRIAIAQLPIRGDARQNGATVRKVMRAAAVEGARLVQFPEGMLSGYAKNPIQDWSEVDWHAVREELRTITALAAELKVWVVLGSAHPLTPPHRPHNSLYIISDKGHIVNRYDKRFCSHTETTRFYSPGTAAVTFDIDGFRFGCLICIEVNFPQLFMEYARLGVDCLLLSTYPEAAVFADKARAHAAIHNYWVSMASCSERTDIVSSALFDPDGGTVKQIKTAEGFTVADMDRTAPELDIALNKARPWRTQASSGEFYRPYYVDDPRSADRTCM